MLQMPNQQGQELTDGCLEARNYNSQTILKNVTEER